MKGRALLSLSELRFSLRASPGARAAVGRLIRLTLRFRRGAQSGVDAKGSFRGQLGARQLFNMAVATRKPLTYRLAAPSMQTRHQDGRRMVFAFAALDR
jgi:hypothetical protein